MQASESAVTPIEKSWSYKLVLKYAGKSAGKLFLFLY